MYKICLSCGNKFSHISLKKKYCSNKCVSDAKKTGEYKKCLHCGCEVYVRKSSLGDSEVYCSYKCSGAAKRKGEHRECLYCGFKFYVRKSLLDKYKEHFCCIEHYTEWQARNQPRFNCKKCGVLVKAAKSNKTSYCGLKCWYSSDEYKTHMEKMWSKRGECPNKFEAALYDVMKNLGIAYEPQYLINERFLVDAYVETSNLIVEFDGDYWHGNPLVYPSPDERQAKQVKLDKARNAYMKKCGIKMLRIWESDWKANKEEVISKIKSAI
jgi:very-short-patch-repair endonuclease